MSEKKEEQKAVEKKTRMVKVKAVRLVQIPGEFAEDKKPFDLAPGAEHMVSEECAAELCKPIDGPLSGDTVGGKYQHQKIYRAEVVKG